MKKYFLALATNFKNENDYLKEWLDYHLNVGVDHFYLYNQDGSKLTDDILEPYIEAGKVTSHLWTQWDGTRYDGPTKFYQRNKNHMGFAHAAANYRSQVQWLMKIDVDEFLFPLKEESSLKAWLAGVDKSKFKGIRIPRINFGNNGHETKPKEPVLESYTKREESYSDHKDLANGDFLSNNRFCYSAHWWHYKLFKSGKILKDHHDIGWRINHYYIKSLEEYLSRQNVSRGRPTGEKGFEEKNRRCNSVEDTSMIKLLQEISNPDFSG
ncbi:MAG: glycosyltransferase family 92 protein [Bacteroidota bacterium]